ncbi:MFS transporter [Chloroflexota bacterium]
MSEFKNLRKIFSQWGGGTSAFFAYAHGSHDLCPALIVPLLPLIRTDLGLTYLQSGILIAAYAITAGLSQFFGGWMGDRFGRRIVVSVGMGGVGLATMAVGFTSSYYSMLFVLFIMGVFAGAYHPSIIPMLFGCFGAEKRGKALGLHMVGGSIGFAAGPLIGGLIAVKLGWHFAFIILGIPALVAAGLILKKYSWQEYAGAGKPVSHTSTANDGTVYTAERRGGIGQVLRPFLGIASLAILTQLMVGSAMAFIPLYLVDKYNVAPAYAAMWMGILRGGGIPGNLFGGWLSDKWNRRNALLLVLVATGPLLYLFTRLPFSAFLLVVLVIFGVVTQMRGTTIQPFLMDNTPPHLMATVFGIYFGIAREGISLVQPVAGYFMDIFGIVEVFHFIALICVALSLVALLTIIRPRLGRRTHTA